MKTQEELAKLRDISSQKQSSLNALLSEKQSLNSSINQYRSLNQTSKQEYGQSLQRLQDIETEISQYDQSIADAESNINVLEEKLSEISTFEDFMQDMDSILSEYTTIEGKKLDPYTMRVEKLPEKEILNSGLHKEVCKKKCIEAFEQLLVKLDGVNAVDSEGKTLLMHSLSNGFFSAVDILLSNPDIDLDIQDDKGQNALYYACSIRHIDYVEKILILNSNVNTITDNPYKITPLWIACQNGHLDAVKFLLENGADPNLSRLDNGVSPACIAARNKHVNVVKHLLSNPDIDLFLQDNDGKRVIDYVVQHCPESLEDLSLDSFISYLSTVVKEDSASTNTSVHSSIFDDSQSLIASHVTSETSMLGDQDSD